MWVVHWSLNGKTGHGLPLDWLTAKAWRDYGNKEHGAGTHWLEEA
jgi:hypothetical protein